MTLFPRSSGILLHLTSLPGPYGIGDMGESAFRFVDFLVEAGQQIWQFLPLSPTNQGNSPYSSYSAFAGNPLLISPTELVEEGFLSHDDLDPGFFLPNADQVDFHRAGQLKRRLLATAVERFRAGQNCEAIDEFESFCTLQQWWLRDYALFAALLHHYGHDGWTRWDSGLARREKVSLSEWRQILAPQIESEQFIQYLFFRQWRKLKQYANRHGVRLFGDMPIFVSHGSADVWANQDIFFLNKDGTPQVVAGVPPDYFSQTGQLWGNPLYRWDRLKQTGYQWWMQRFRATLEMVDLLRIDHFRGFEAYWEIPANAQTAVHGQWVAGPGEALFTAAHQALGDLPIVAEDLGLITEEVHHLRDRLGFPGMRVLQFGFESPDDTYHRPESFPENSVAYTGTHDNETLAGWYLGRKRTACRMGKRDLLDRYLSADTCDDSVHWQLMAMVLNSASHTTILPLQDVLGLGNQARMNTPGTIYGNWQWRLLPHQLDGALAANLRVLTEHSHRLQEVSSFSR